MGGNNTKVESVQTRQRSASILSEYLCLRKIGKGAFATVYLVRRIKDDNLYAMKVVDKLKLDAAEMKYAKSEVAILHKLKHRNVVKTHHIFEDDTRIYIVMEFMNGGSMFTMLKEQPLSERQIAVVAREIAKGLKYCHDTGVTHRDLKLQHILLKKSSKPTEFDNWAVKIADFGLAKFVNSRELMHTMCGSPSYVAPEVLDSQSKGGYGDLVDMWSFGIMLYIMLTGERPFRTDLPPSISFAQIRRGLYSQKARLWPEISDTAKDLIARLLTVDPKKRLSAEQALAHPFLFGNASNDLVHRTQESMAAYERQDSTEVRLTAEPNDDTANRSMADLMVTKEEPQEEDSTQVRLEESGMTEEESIRVLKMLYGKDPETIETVRRELSAAIEQDSSALNG